MYFNKNNFFTRSLFKVICEAKSAVSEDIILISSKTLALLEDNDIKLTGELELELQMHLCMNASSLISALATKTSAPDMGDDNFHDLFSVRLTGAFMDNVRHITVYVTLPTGEVVHIEHHRDYTKIPSL
jgi:hypothetical protein